ncbi:uncharacterized protein B0T23DRAFT_212086 [Neurospora hispaniola]|uniref:Uncharacterized protein n=1 Tax=Neurospora hispaniola TaxID=588809 RepID=A0AAJ0MNE5_9PEZI|nr:hypothetical protein B0T23DRAFT_212086 [Neurospora hispaniola]
MKGPKFFLVMSFLWKHFLLMADFWCWMASAIGTKTYANSMRTLKLYHNMILCYFSLLVGMAGCLSPFLLCISTNTIPSTLHNTQSFAILFLPTLQVLTKNLLVFPHTPELLEAYIGALSSSHSVLGPVDGPSIERVASK